MGLAGQSFLEEGSHRHGQQMTSIASFPLYARLHMQVPDKRTGHACCQQLLAQAADQPWEQKGQYGLPLLSAQRCDQQRLHLQGSQTHCFAAPQTARHLSLGRAQQEVGQKTSCGRRVLVQKAGQVARAQKARQALKGSMPGLQCQ